MRQLLIDLEKKSWPLNKSRERERGGGVVCFKKCAKIMGHSPPLPPPPSWFNPYRSVFLNFSFRAGEAVKKNADAAQQPPNEKFGRQSRVEVLKFLPQLLLGGAEGGWWLQGYHFYDATSDWPH